MRPVRDVFAAIFFVSVGMIIDPAGRRALAGGPRAHAGRASSARSSAVTIGAFLTGHGRRTSVQAGMSLAQIGEFSFIIAGVGVASARSESSVSGRGRRVRDHDADDAAAHPSLRSRGGIDRPLAPRADPDDRGALCIVDRAGAKRAKISARPLQDSPGHPRHTSRRCTPDRGGHRRQSRDRAADRHRWKHHRPLARSRAARDRACRGRDNSPAHVRRDHQRARTGKYSGGPRISGGRSREGRSRRMLHVAHW